MEVISQVFCKAPDVVPHKILLSRLESHMQKVMVNGVPVGIIDKECPSRGHTGTNVI